jgi:hypothetical protein
MPTEDKLSYNDFRFVESLLYDQKTHDTAIAELEAELTELLDNLLPSSTASFVDMSESKGEAISQPERWAIKRDENLRVKYLRGRIAERKRHKRAISEAMRYLDETECQLVFLRYNEGKPHNYCSKKLNMWDNKEWVPLRAYWRMRKRVLGKVAKFVGIG